jgi:5'-deoxynucleotidase YfbR-like HD superfamily hydrolase
MFSNEEILEEVKKIQYLYELKHEIRYAQTRADTTESVAEHIYGTHICALYFLPLEDTDNSWDKSRIFQMITLHDIDEIETGDVIGFTKTQAMRENEANAMRTVMEKSPLHMQDNMRTAIDEYEMQSTKESQFVKAIDKFEALIQTFGSNGKIISHATKSTEEKIRNMREPYIQIFPVMHGFFKVIHQKMIDENYFI